MCGLVGFVGRTDRSSLEAMTTRLAHRGPDGAGYYEHPEHEVSLGHRRLSVLDVAGGDQPMLTEDRALAVVFNGEIYNHAELRLELSAKGHKFRSDHSDTEVLLHGYREWGSDLPSKLNGMFVFVIHDLTARSLFMARDRFGEKPLYIFDNGRDFAFASEPGAFLAYPGFTAELDHSSLQKFFAYGFLPQPNAIYRYCSKLPAGSWLRISLPDKRRNSECYWRFELTPDRSFDNRPEGELVEELRHLLLQAVRRRLISDVPLGLFLSGGVDSSAILAMMSKSRPADEVESYSIGFDSPSFDETRFALMVARQFGAKHTNQTLSFENARESLWPLLQRMGEPLGDPSLLPTFLVAGMARKTVTVALSGDGGDELFAGYDPFEALGAGQVYSKAVPRLVHLMVTAMVGKRPRSTGNMSLDFKLRRFLAGMNYPASMWLPVWMSSLEPANMGDVFEQPLPAEELYSEAIELWRDGEARGLGIVERALEYFTRIYLVDDILVKSDRATMLHGLESRAVFLDNDLVNFSARLPTHFKYRRGKRKYLLKQAMRGILDDLIIDRPKKGFGIPIAEWLKTTPETVPMRPVAGVKAQGAATLWHEHRAGLGDHKAFGWNWLAIQALNSTEA